ncbi:sigma-54-dependent transcriptional regulator [Pararhodobacter aggregans]|uniref:Nif-specific regulatory protein n=1 Tax=Pararhodobacter aggregans TaxID=404875 RepID=A0A2T7UP44_9RHOB|nr:sigma-54 dependent transcriptional regulator [Pararhodobacter aggregans]PTX00915.1 two component Fis family sigma54 specific transcriptional regulator [Pararhodobacter aggregans]PVE46437.1 sigma-54-dependent Fis family transcriptional regulator [Pararhodobacter aggregans]
MTLKPDSETILLVEDTPSLQMIYRAALMRAGYAVECCGTAAEGMAAFHRLNSQIVLLDLMLPDRTGLEVMEDILREAPQTCVIVITANGSINKAVEMMRAGAHEFLVKPFDDQRLLAAIENARKALRHRPQAPRDVSAVPVLAPFIGHSPTMLEVYDKIRSVARSMATVFITGESGTGKELCAEAVHQTSARAGGPFVALNCGAIPVDLLESEVFGHLRGSFTGAINDKIGAAAAADGGTLFLDEICEMDLNLQTKLLRFLQTSTITPVGATKPRKVNVRIICATNRNPLEEVRRGRFREDLYYRLHVVPVHLPPLRDRGEDVIEISERLIVQMAREEGHVFTSLAPRVKDLFRSLPWPGNVRQLINVLRNVVVLNEGPQVTVEMLPPDLLADRPTPAPAPEERPQVTMLDLSGRTLAQIERIVIEDALARHGDSVPKAARELDVSASTLYRKREAWEKADRKK